ncbi:hypothetical protein ABZ815_16510 [Nonomuraea sp. NPDC047529]|uniref:hypothetical protein n=1 Tax=Nonomuraea sp. NPDC047529 TaxID=3155623 RepID=UPI0033C8346A
MEDVDKWLAGKTGEPGTRSVKSAMRRDKVKRNVVDLCDIPEGRTGRPSKALTLAQALAVPTQAEQGGERMRAYIVLSLLIGARTEELRALLWSHVVAYDGSVLSDSGVPIEDVHASSGTPTRWSPRPSTGIRSGP